MIIGIDVSNFAYREVATGHGPNQIVRKALAAQEKIPDTHCYLAYDCDGKTFRHEIFPEYKTRKGDEELRRRVRDVIEETKPLATAAGVRVVQRDTYEADDILASLARQGRKRDETVIIFSADKDMFPLLMYRGVRLFKWIKSIGYDGPRMLVRFVDEITEESVFERYGVTPSQWLDFRCMCGDPSDSIKGLAGVGEAKSKQILNVYGTLDSLFADWEVNREGFTPKEQAKWDSFRDELSILRRLFHPVDLDVLEH